MTGVADEQPKPGKILKVLFLDEAGAPVGEFKSQQIPEDPFAGFNTRNLQDPPFSLEQLVYLAEIHPTHGAAIDQKVADIVGQGWEWELDEEAEESDEMESLRKELDEWVESLAPDEQTIHEVLKLGWEDYEKTAQGYFEVVRDAKGQVRRLYHVPSHTCRFHKDGIRIAQVRGEKIVWFKRWGSPDDLGKYVNKSSGVLKDDVPEDKRANELLVVQRGSSRNSWYGIPKYISALGWIVLSLAARDDNLLFFQNRREPRWAIVLYNLEDDPTIVPDLEQAFKIDLKEPHKNIIIPIAGEGKIDFKQMASDRADGSFERLEERSDARILTAHRTPPERLGMSKVGPLGGSVTIEASRVYKEGVVAEGQGLLGARINRFIHREFKGRGIKKSGLEDEPKPLPWSWKPTELDLAEEAVDTEMATKQFSGNIINLREARAKLGLGPLMKKKLDVNEIPELDEEGNEQEVEDDRNDKLFSEISKGGADPNALLDPFGMGSFGSGFNDPASDALQEVRRDVRELIQKVEESDDDRRRSARN